MRMTIYMVYFEKVENERGSYANHDTLDESYINASIIPYHCIEFLMIILYNMISI